jgi:hypothetical protein
MLFKLLTFGMRAIPQREILLERRQQSVIIKALWGKLSLAQKFVASSLVMILPILDTVMQAA